MTQPRFLTGLFVLAVLAVLSVSTCAADARFYDSRLERQLIDDASDGHLGRFSLTHAAFIACQTSRAEMNRHLATFDYHCRQLQHRVRPSTSTSARMRIAFDYLHEQILTGQYQEECTSLARLFSEGNFNCVSATIVFHGLCRRLGLKPVAVAAPAHVFSRIGHTNVETTCPYWFQPQGCQRKQYQRTRDLTPIELLGKVYYNRGVAYLESRQFSEAIAVLELSLLLDPKDTTARENLLAGINNWALHLCDRQKYPDAVELLMLGTDMAPDYAPFLANDLHIHNQWVQSLCRKRRFSDAIAIIEHGRKRRPNEPLFERGAMFVYRDWAVALFEEGLGEQAFALLAQLRRQDSRQHQLWACEVDAIRMYASSLVQSGRREQALAVIQRGLTRQPDNPVLRRMKTDLTPR